MVEQNAFYFSLLKFPAEIKQQLKTHSTNFRPHPDCWSCVTKYAMEQNRWYLNGASFNSWMSLILKPNYVVFETVLLPFTPWWGIVCQSHLRAIVRSSLKCVSAPSWLPGTPAPLLYSFATQLSVILGKWVLLLRVASSLIVAPP